MEHLINGYLHDLLNNFEEYSLTEEDIKKGNRDRAEFITEKLGRKKFRRRVLAEKTRQTILEKVKLSIVDDRPLHFVIPFGGYKHFWNPSHPEPDWAELFHFKYLTDYVSPIIKVHKPGVIIEYMSEDLILPRMNNYPEEAVQAYSTVFMDTIAWYNKQIPNNLVFRFFKVSDRCNSKKIIQKVESLLPERKAKFAQLSPEEKERELHRSYRSVFWDGKVDLTGLTEQEKLDRIIESRLIELAYYETEALPENMGDYLGEDNHICLVFSFGTTHDNDEYQDLTLGSTCGSVVDFWIGRGILEKKEDRLLPTIISKNQHEDIKDKLVQVDVDGILPFKNFQKIEMVTL